MAIRPPKSGEQRENGTAPLGPDAATQPAGPPTLEPEVPLQLLSLIHI